MHELKLFVRVLMLLLSWRATPLNGASTLLKNFIPSSKAKMSTQTDTVRYELMVIVSPEIGEAAINKRLDALRKSIKDFGGEIFFEDIWGLRDLAYQIRKQDQGYYAVLDLNFDPQRVRELERMLQLETEVLRHLMIKLPSIYQPKTISEMEAEVEQIMPEEKKVDKKEKKPRIGQVRKAEIPKEEPVKEEKPAKVEKAEKEEKKEEKAETEETPKKPAKKKEEKKSLEDIDAKLDSILSNPDINF